MTCDELVKLKAVLEDEKRDVLLFHGDTTTSFVAALACFYLQIPVGHVEVDLRTHVIFCPWPEKFNRQAVDIVSEYSFAPTEASKKNLLGDGKPESRVWVTGNTGIDALRTTVREGYSYPELEWAEGSRLILTDSGGIQEETLSPGKPVLVMRDTTERPEGVAAGTLKLVGPRRTSSTAS